eukprot:781590-Prymnesium_polylepis.1
MIQHSVIASPCGTCCIVASKVDASESTFAAHRLSRIARSRLRWRRDSRDDNRCTSFSGVSRRIRPSHTLPFKSRAARSFGSKTTPSRSHASTKPPSV